MENQLLKLLNCSNETSYNVDDCMDYFINKAVFITGGAGSIGKELCKQLLKLNVSCVVVVDNCEYNIYSLQEEFCNELKSGQLKCYLCDINDKKTVEKYIQQHKPSVIFHAAAYKHVHIMELQPNEAIKNNFKSTVNLTKISVKYNVSKFILISTDKAINPTNVMGASKRLAEIYVQGLSQNLSINTKFVTVRFGNVLGSSGSVVPTFKKQIQLGGPIRVTHPEVTRFFMTISDAVSLVIESSVMGIGGEIFVLDMGRPIKILDLARSLIELDGRKSNKQIKIEFVGLRPGEKLFEELQHTDENLNYTNHPKIKKLLCEPVSMVSVTRMLDLFGDDINDLSSTILKERLKKVVPEYKPYFVE